VHSHRNALPPQPESIEECSKKGEGSNGIIVMMNAWVKDSDKKMIEDEKIQMQKAMDQMKTQSLL
jgi:hypothetical protein